MHPTEREGSQKYYQPLQRETVIALLIKALTKASPSKRKGLYDREWRKYCQFVGLIVLMVKFILKQERIIKTVKRGEMSVVSKSPET